TLVTVAAVLALQLAVLFVAERFLFDSTVFPTLVAGGLADLAPEAAPYLLSTPVDRSGLTRWLNERARHRNLHLPFDLDFLSDPASVLAVADRDGRVVASTDPELAPAGEPLGTRLGPEADAVARAALAGEGDRSRLVRRGSDRTVAGAAPIVGPGGTPIGVLFLDLDLSGAPGRVALRIARGLLFSAVV